METEHQEEEAIGKYSTWQDIIPTREIGALRTKLEVC